MHKNNELNLKTFLGMTNERDSKKKREKRKCLS